MSNRSVSHPATGVSSPVGALDGETQNPPQKGKLTRAEPSHEQTRAEWEQGVVLRHRYGDASAFEEVYEEFASLVYNVSLRLCGRPEYARDLSQEVFLRIHKGLVRFRGKSTLKTWIYRVTLNHCRSRLRRRQLQLEPITDETGRDREFADPSRGPEGHASASDAKRVVMTALLALDPAYREAVILRDLEELSYQEIADVTGVRIGTVRSRISRGRERLREALERNESS